MFVWENPACLMAVLIFSYLFHFLSLHLPVLTRLRIKLEGGLSVKEHQLIYWFNHQNNNQMEIQAQANRRCLLHYNSN